MNTYPERFPKFYVANNIDRGGYITELDTFEFAKRSYCMSINPHLLINIRYHLILDEWDIPLVCEKPFKRSSSTE